jgi:hypothetical protein
MKNKINLFKFSIFLGLQIFSSIAFSQAPEKMSYQSVLRGTNNALVTNQNVRVKISLLQGTITGSAAYVEEHATNTNANGLVSLSIGGGTLISGSFSTINWANGPYFVKMEADPTGGTNYTISGTSQLLSVPYALHAKNGFNRMSSNGDSLYLSNGQVFIRGTSNGTSSSLVLPTITTNAVNGITSNSATFGGSISNANGNQIMEKGIVYSTSQNPTMFSNKIPVGNGIGTFDTITNFLCNNTPQLLKANTTYYVRAYAITENNFAIYGNEVLFTTLSIGQAGQGGGVVFYDKGFYSNGWRYLESSVQDQGSDVLFGCYNNPINITQYKIGSGKDNTTLILSSGCPEQTYAAKICDELILGGLSDWFLPSRHELNLMYLNLYNNNLCNFQGIYWSSTVLSPQSGDLPVETFPFIPNVNLCEDIPILRNSVYYGIKVRAIRSF